MDGESRANHPILLITGGSRGIGAASARLAARRGYAVCVNYRDRREAAEQVVDEIRRSGGKAIAVRADVSSEADVTSLFETVDRDLGRLDGLVDNAATLESQMRLESMDAARIQRMFATNTIGAFLCARERRSGGCRPATADREARSSMCLRAPPAPAHRANTLITPPPKGRWKR